MREGLLLTVAGIAAGLVIAFASAGVLRALLFDVSPQANAIASVQVAN